MSTLATGSANVVVVMGVCLAIGVMATAVRMLARGSGPVKREMLRNMQKDSSITLNLSSVKKNMHTPRLAKITDHEVDEPSALTTAKTSIPFV